MSSAPLVYVIILNWNRADETIACLNTVLRSDYPNFRAVVIDNGSTDDSVTRIQEAFPDIKLLCNDANLGYAEGNNVGIRHALENEAEYVLLLNDDARVEKDTLSHLATAAADPTVAAVGGKIKVYENPERLWAAGECFPREQGFPPDDGRFEVPCEIDYAVGCCILMCRESLRDIGLLNSDFFAVHGEREWCYRARAADYRILYTPEAVVRHKVSSSFTSNWSPAYHYLFTRNQLQLWEHQGIIPSNWRCLQGVFLLWRREVNFVMQHQGAKLKRALGVTLGVWDYLRGHLGPPPTGLQGLR